MSFDKQYRIGRVHLEPEGVEVKMIRTDHGIEVVVPILEVHSMVVAELEPVRQTQLYR